jgi:hypothetical protein
MSLYIITSLNQFMNKNQILALVLLGLLFISPYLKPIQADNTNTVKILNPQVQPAIIKVGDTFAINATLVNNSTNTINVQNGCGGPFSVVFDNHATVDLKKICNWMAIQIILKPGENITGTSLSSNLAYRATAPGTANATITFSYIVGNQTSHNLSFDKNATSISKSFLFTISNETTQTSHTSPLKQFKTGIAAKDVKCEQDLQLVIKAEDGSPACIKPNDATMLVQRGWATPL